MKALLAALFLAFGLLCPCAEAQQKAPLVPPPFDEAKNTEQPPAGSKVEYVKLPAQASKPSPDEGEDVTELFRKPLLTKPPNKVNLLDEFDPPTAEAARADAESRQRLVVWRWGGLALVPLALISLSAWGASILVKSGRIGRLLLALRAIPERLLTPRVVLVVACLLLIASWAYPPGFERESRHVSRGWFFLFDTDSDMQVDFPRLILLDAIIAAGAGMVAWSVSGSSSSRGTVVRLAFYLMVGVPVLAVAGGMALVCVWAIPQAEAWANQPRKQLPATLTDADFADPNDFEIVTNEPRKAFEKKPPFDPTTAQPDPPFDPDAFLAALEKKVAQPKPRTDHRAGIHVGTGVTFLDAPDANELAKIILFDVAPNTRYGDIYGVHGRIRNELARPVTRIGARLTIHNSEGQLIEVRTFWLEVDINKRDFVRADPGAPVSFETRLEIKHLPKDFKFEVAPIEALYAR